MFSGKISFNSDKLKRFTVSGLLLLFAVILSAIVFSPFLPQNIDLSAGDIAPKNIVSPRHLEFESSEDKAINQRLIQKTKNSIGKVYTVDQTINADILDNVSYFLDSIHDSSVDSIGLHAKQVLSDDELDYLRALSDDPYDTFSTAVKAFTDSYIQYGLKEINNTQLLESIQEQFKDYDNTSHTIILKILTKYLESNFKVDDLQSNALVAQALNGLTLQKTLYRQGQVIVFKSSVVEAKHIEAFKSLNMYNLQVNFMYFIGIFIICLTALALLERFIRTFNIASHRIKNFILILLIMTLVISLARFVYTFSFLPDSSMNFLLVPISISSMLLSFLITSNISLLTGSLTSILIAFMFPLSFETVLFLFFSNAVTTFSIHKQFKRSELIYAGYVVGLFNVLFVLALGLLQGHSDFIWYSFNMPAAFANGVVSSMISLAILPYLESLFKITTSQTLLELSNLNHPLLKKLLMNAPGTYQHSLMVASLAEAAAEAVNANTVLCRVGSYFHDIGKLKRPLFFSENQFSNENPHDNLAPRMSKMIILNHVKDGHEMAVKHKLPKIIQDIILQHHGTSLLSFFYQKENVETGETLENDNEFRYAGPKPQTKEAGIVMLSDSFEATIRSLSKPTPQKIEGIINKIFKDKLDDDQLSDCPLSFDEIDKIKVTFLNFFRGAHHKRLDYQKEVDKLNKSDKDSEHKKSEGVDDK